MKSTENPHHYVKDIRNSQTDDGSPPTDSIPARKKDAENDDSNSKTLYYDVSDNFELDSKYSEDDSEHSQGSIEDFDINESPSDSQKNFNRTHATRKNTRQMMIELKEETRTDFEPITSQFHLNQLSKESNESESKKGRIGTVYIDCINGRICAVKRVQKSKNYKQIKNEVEVFTLTKKIKSDNIIEFIGTDENKYYYFFYLEHMDYGSLQSIKEDCLKRGIDFSEPMIWSIAQQVLKALSSLHSHYIIHADLHPGNILMNSNGIIKIIDFDTSVIVKDIDTKVNDDIHKVITSFGTPGYNAPETVSGNQGACYKSDIYSLGKTLFYLCSKQVEETFEPQTCIEIIFEVEETFERRTWIENLSDDLKDFIARCRKVVVDERPSADELLQHLFILEVTDHEVLKAFICDINHTK